jgi:tetratricopeptide (TPR) repeat protein
MESVPSAADASAQEHNARVMKNWLEHQKMSKGHGWGGTWMGHTHTDSDEVKPETNKAPDDVLPIWARQLTAGASHRKRRLSGVVIEDAIFTGGIYFVMKDAIGDLVKVGVYNIPNASPAVAAQLFQCGKCVTIIEPYLKFGMDGLAFVRVDNPATDVLTDSHLLPGCDAAAWQLEGKQLFAAHMTTAAFECWSRALSFSAASAPVATLLTNRAAALLRSEQPAEAARDCFVALTIDSWQVKAAGRLVEALSALELKEAARTYALGFAERWPELKSRLQPHLQSARPAERNRVAAETLWWETEVVSKVLFIQPELEAECTDVTGDQLKALGNNLFRSGSFDAAAKVYSRALACVEGVDVLVKLMCNRAAAAMKDESYLSALTNATASLVLDPSDVKSWYRRASALCKLDMNKEGLAACTQATKLLETRVEDNLAFEPLIKAMTKAETTPPQMSPEISTAEQKKMLQEFKDRVTPKDVLGTPQLSMLNLIMNKFPEAMQIKLFGCKILPMPSFHLELAKHRGWPKGVDVQWAKSHLHFVYEQCSSLPYSMQFAFSQEGNVFADVNMLKRANGQPARLKWLFCNKERQNGDVMPEEVLGSIHYPEYLRQPFTNQAYRKELLSLGTVHVAVGFVDLGVLLSCDIVDAPEGRTGPLRFVGVELSCFAVAKSLVIWQMTKDAANGKTSADAILQVWFSSTWLPSTEVSFRAAVRAVRSQGDTFYGSNEKVSSILEHWTASRGVSLKRARAHWAETVTTQSSGIGHMKQLDDRLDMAAYELTGDVFVGQSAQLTGSICWWDCPDGTPANQSDQTFLSATDVQLVLKERSPKQSFFHAAEAFLIRRVAKMITWAGSGAITVEAKIGNVSDLVPQIAALNPWTMSWSNVSDYYRTSEFHRIARACSVNGDTMHFAYSMNWSTDVAGSHLIDYNASEQRKKLFEEGNRVMDILYQRLDFKSVFRYPPPENPMNIVDYALGMLWRTKWIDHFFAIARNDGPCQVGTTDPAIFNPLTNTGNKTIFFTFTYDPEINLNPQAQPYSSADIFSMSAEELKDTISFLHHEKEKGTSGNFFSAADRKYFDQIPLMMEEMKKRLASLQAANKE